MTSDHSLTSDDIDELQHILDQHRESANDSGMWSSIEEVPDAAVDATAAVLRSMAADQTDGTRCLKSSQVAERMGAERAERDPSADWIGQVCTLLAEEQHEYDVVVERVSDNHGVNGSTWRASLPDCRVR